MSAYYADFSILPPERERMLSLQEISVDPALLDDPTPEGDCE